MLTPSPEEILKAQQELEIKQMQEAAELSAYMEAKQRALAAEGVRLFRQWTGGKQSKKKRRGTKGAFGKCKNRPTGVLV